MSRHLEDLFDKLEEVKVEFLGATMLDVAVHILCDTMVDSFAKAEVELLGPKSVTVNAVTVGDALADRLLEVMVKLIGVKLVDVEFKSIGVGVTAEVDVEMVLIKRRRVDTKTLDHALVDK